MGGRYGDGLCMRWRHQANKIAVLLMASQDGGLDFA
jgi:hypothetical protein